MLVACLVAAPMAMAEWQSMVLNYGRNDYGRATQMWTVCADQDQYVFFANREGLFEYDYAQWQTHKLPGGESLRSVMVSRADQRIYIGAINEFGYFEIAPNGELSYVSLSADQELPEIRYAGNVWNVHKQGNTLLFRTEDRVIRIADGEYEVLWPGQTIGYSCMLDNALHLATDQALLVLMGSKFFPIHGSEPVVKHRIKGIISQGKDYLAFTADDGAYLLDGFTATRVPTEADDYMKENEVFCIAHTQDKIAVGTVRGGVVVMDRDGTNPVYYNESNGLQNNTVLSLAFDSQGDLWAGLDRGVSCITMSSPFQVLAGEASSIGLGYTAAINDGTLYIGTNRGLYGQKESTSNMVGYPEVSGQVWDFCKIGQKLYCTTDHGIYSVGADGKVQHVPGLNSAWTLQPMLKHPGLVYAGTYTGMWVMQQDGDNLKNLHYVEGVANSFQTFEQDQNENIWLVNNTMLERLELDADHAEVRFTRDYSVPTGIKLSFLPGREPVSVLTSEGVYRYEERRDSFVPDSVFNEKYIGNTEYLSAARAFGNYYLLAKNQLAIVPEDMEGPKKVFPFSSSLIEVIENFERVIPISPNQAIVPSEKGILFFTEPEDQVNTTHPHFRIRNIFSVTGRDSTLYSSNFMNLKNKIRIEPGYNSMLVVCSNDSRFDGILYQYRLNDGEWSEPSEAPIKQFVDLSPGNYSINAKAIYPDGSEYVDEVQFEVIAPWYRTVWAYLGYTALLLLLGVAIARWDRRRTRAREAKAVMEKEQEMRQMEEELEGEIAKKDDEIAEKVGEIALKEDEIARQQENIAQLEKQKLEDELKHKSLEMANMMVNVVQKNEMLGDIKREVNKVIDQLKGNEARDARKQLMSLTASIDNNINNQEVMGKIEEQFNVLHDNFMTRLTDHYPSLTVN